MYFNQNTTVFLNGNWLPAEQAVTTLYSQTLHYGLGIFEGIRAYPTPAGARIFKAAEHYERLHYSAKVMHLHLPYTVQQLIDASYELLQKNNLANAYLRPLVYTEPLMKLLPPKAVNVFLCAWEWGLYLGSELLHVVVSDFQRPNPRSTYVDAKVTGHYVNSILATHNAVSRGYDEALLLDQNGYVAEGSGANFFYEKDGKLYTPPKGSILMGITRATIIELCQKAGIPVEECLFTPDVLTHADGAFFTGTAAEVAGIQTVNHKPFLKPWEKTIGCYLAQEYKKLVIAG
ncbi:MAG TPA: branched-chain amino acid transaminase [Chitinophagales bacterium]|nr:branched-chain amino acid transaminase [Chitinophagales bacterium]